MFNLKFYNRLFILGNKLINIIYLNLVISFYRLIWKLNPRVKSICRTAPQSNNTENNNPNNQLGYYLAGLIESDGALITPQDNDGKNRPTIKIIFQLKDKPLAEHIRKILGYGSIQKTSSDFAVELFIRNKHGIIDLVSLINGKFRTPKIFKLNRLIDWINNNNNYNSLNINPLKKLPLDISPLNNNSWLSGFSEGDSSFQIRISEPNDNNPYYHISTTYELAQSRINPVLFSDYESVMNTIANFFLSKLGKFHLTTYDRSGKQPGWRVRNSSKSGSSEVAKYFDSFPLFSSKHLDFLCWKEAHNIIVNNQHRQNLGINGITKLKELKEKMNSKRIDFNWDHLNSFYQK